MQLQQLLSKQKEHLIYFFDHLDLSETQAVLTLLQQCTGVLFLTGIGKSGFIAQKIAATLMSTGTKASFLSPVDALHGDLGMLSKEDILIILSKSGETEELFMLLPFVRNKGVRTIALTSNPQSRLVKATDAHLHLPCQGELCPFDLAPTISTTIQMLLGDLVAISLMQTKGVSVTDYAQNHPAGRIGRRATLRVRDLMLPKGALPLCRPEQRLHEVLVDFTEKRCGCMIVVNHHGELEGIFTDGDLRRALQGKGEQILKEKLENLMTRTARAIGQDELAFEALKLMESNQKVPIMVLPVLEKNTVCGLIKMHDLIQAGI